MNFQIVANSLRSRKQQGSIVNISSICSTQAQPNLTTYGASKAALDQLTKTMALELGPYHVSINSSIDKNWVKHIYLIVHQEKLIQRTLNKTYIHVQ